jgi:hypothetical protein
MHLTRKNLQITMIGYPLTIAFVSTIGHILKKDEKGEE